jgi:hypothetical protein
MGVSAIYMSALVQTAGLETYYYLGVRGWFTGPIPTNRGSTMLIGGVLEDGTEVQWTDGIGIRDSDGTFANGGSPSQPCPVWGSVGVMWACGFYGPSTLGAPKKLASLDFLRFSLHDYDTGVTTHCRQGDPDCYWVPETDSWLLVATGLLGLAFVARRRREEVPCCPGPIRDT